MAEDKRKYNGGHSTKAVRKTDKRLNPFKNVLKEAVTPEQLKKVLGSMVKKAVDGDTKAATLLLNYYLGKPKESIEIQGNHNIQFELKKLISFNADDVEEAEEVD